MDESGGGPLAGVKVIELGLWLAGPACATILADWGADVVKIEPLDGDPFRGLAWAYGGTMNPPFELDNRGKRSVAVDLRQPEGREVAWALLADADVFVTNYRPGGLDRLGLDWPTLHERFPNLVYGSITGYGLAGPERDRASYDMGAYWSRAGVAAALTPEGQDLPYQRGGFGDHLTGMALAGGIAAALFGRQAARRGPARVDLAAARRDVPDRYRPEHQPAHRATDGRRVGPLRPQPAAHRLPLWRRRVDLAARSRR